MNDKEKTKEQRTDELLKIHLRIAEFKASEIERRNRKEANIKSEARYRELSGSITDGFPVFYKDLMFTYGNKASEQLTGQKRK